LLKLIIIKNVPPLWRPLLIESR